MEDSQAPVVPDTQARTTAAPSQARVRVRPAGTPGGYGPIAGVTVGYETGEDATRAEDSARASRSAAVSGQAIAAAIFLLALLPPIAVCAWLGFTGRGNAIPYAKLWVWGPAAITLLLALRLLFEAAKTRRVVGLVLPFSLTLAFLATPCAVLFYLEVIAHRPVTLVQGIVGIVLYSLSAIALFMASLALSRTE